MSQTLDLTSGSVTKKILLFALPLMAGNILQQLYNVVDTLIVGKYIGETALAAVGASYSLMIFLTSILLGLCMGSGVYLSIRFGEKDMPGFKNGLYQSFALIGLFAVLLNILMYACMESLLWFLRIPYEVRPQMTAYLLWIFSGLPATFFYNFFACSLRAIGNSVTPLFFLGVSALLNIILDLAFVLGLSMGVEGAAIATVISQYTAGLGILLYYYRRYRSWLPMKADRYFKKTVIREISSLSFLTCLQQSIMNFGILMVQGLVNSFGTAVMAAFAAGVKIDTLAYSPVQDFGNAFSTFVAQNHGAGQRERIRRGLGQSLRLVCAFCAAISLIVVLFSEKLMGIFIDAENTRVIAIGSGYLRTEGIFYFLIGILFLFYGYFRAVQQPMVSVILTVLSLGCRVALAYALSAVPAVGVMGIWAAIPIGWCLADLAGFWFLHREQKRHPGP
ncbi:MAG: MATE family efflux transporter [Lachnospiraceae bacterium]|nr:MATE family efflux transporter [Lachnospiraceae bacterium]